MLQTLQGLNTLPKIFNFFNFKNEIIASKTLSFDWSPRFERFHTRFGPPIKRTETRKKSEKTRQ